MKRSRLERDCPDMRMPQGDAMDEGEDPVQFWLKRLPAKAVRLPVTSLLYRTDALEDEKRNWRSEPSLLEFMSAPSCGKFHTRLPSVKGRPKKRLEEYQVRQALTIVSIAPALTQLPQDILGSVVRLYLAHFEADGWGWVDLSLTGTGTGFSQAAKLKHIFLQDKTKGIVLLDADKKKGVEQQLLTDMLSKLNLRNSKPGLTKH